MPGFPILVMDQPAKLLLQGSKAKRFGLAKKDWLFRRQLLAPLHNSLQGVCKVVEMQIWLSGVEIARIDVADELTLVNASDLAGQKGRVAHIVVNAGGAHHDRWNGATLLADQCFGADL